MTCAEAASAGCCGASSPTASTPWSGTGRTREGPGFLRTSTFSGWWRNGTGRHAGALFEEYLTIQRKLGSCYFEGVALNNLALGSERSGDLETARVRYEESLTIFRSLGSRRMIALLSSNFGALRILEQKPAAARALLEEGLAVHREMDDRWQEAQSLNLLGMALADEGKIDQARGCCRESLSMFQELGDPLGASKPISQIAFLEAADGHPGLAARLPGATDALRRRMGAPLTAEHRRLADEMASHVRDALGEDFRPL